VTFPDALAWLYSTQQFGIKLGLENIRRLLEALGHPEDRLRFIHVAGTNGKGSVCAMMDAILRAAGWRSGLYTSPHLIDFRERMRVNGEKITPDEAAAGLSRIREISAAWEYAPTYFEITTALAMHHFAEKGCEIVVLETGMGGRLDATNVVRPLAVVITPIALDHTQWLGPTLAAIAAEKAGIIKSAVPVICALQEPEAAEVLSRKAKELEAPLTVVNHPLEGRAIGLRGEFQKQNAALAMKAIRAAGLAISDEASSAGLRDVRWAGRFQVIDGRIILDGGHNPHAAAQLVQVWRETFGGEKAVIIFGALSDKDYTLVLKILEPLAEEFRLVPVRSKRAATTAELAGAVSAPHREFSSLAEAWPDSASGKILVTGSLFLVGEAMEYLAIEP